MKIISKISATKIAAITSILLISATSSSYAGNRTSNWDRDNMHQTRFSDEMQVQRQGNVAYVTGGIGDEERNMLHSVRHEYNLRILNSSKRGEFMGDTNIAIYDSRGHEIVNANDAGPLLYARLPAGRYSITAENDDGDTQTRNIRVSSDHATRTHLVWN